MPPRARSRYRHCVATYDHGGRLFLTEREPLRYLPLADNREHVVRSGDSLQSIAYREFAAIDERPEGLWWILADFQPVPIHDPTIQLVPGTTIVIPSDRTIRERIFARPRTRTP